MINFIKNKFKGAKLSLLFVYVSTFINLIYTIIKIVKQSGAGELYLKLETFNNLFFNIIWIIIFIVITLIYLLMVLIKYLKCDAKQKIINVLLVVTAVIMFISILLFINLSLVDKYYFISIFRTVSSILLFNQVGNSSVVFIIICIYAICPFVLIFIDLFLIGNVLGESYLKPLVICVFTNIIVPEILILIFVVISFAMHNIVTIIGLVIIAIIGFSMFTSSGKSSSSSSSSLGDTPKVTRKKETKKSKIVASGPIELNGDYDLYHDFNLNYICEMVFADTFLSKRNAVCKYEDFVSGKVTILLNGNKVNSVRKL